MMLAIGFSAKGAASDFPSAGDGEIVTLCGPSGDLDTPNARLRASLTCMRQAEAFLPISPRRPISLPVAEGWLKTNQQMAQSALGRLSGLAQITMSLRPRHAVKRSLRARAEFRNRAAAAISELRDMQSPLDTRHRISHDQAELHSLLPLELASVSPKLPAHFQDEWQIVASGPWPAFRFFGGPA